VEGNEEDANAEEVFKLDGTSDIGPKCICRFPRVRRGGRKCHSYLRKLLHTTMSLKIVENTLNTRLCCEVSESVKEAVEKDISCIISRNKLCSQLIQPAAS